MTGYLRALAKRMLLLVPLLAVAACSHFSKPLKPVPTPKTTRAQLSIGYSMLYEEADGIHKLKWIMMFKSKNEEMEQLTTDLVHYYQHLAESLQKLSMEYPAVHIDATTMSDIEAQERKAIGEDLAKDMAPLIGKGGIAFERETLLMFYNSLNEQRHLVAVMLSIEPDDSLKSFLEETKAQLDERYAKVGALLNRRYFTQ